MNYELYDRLIEDTSDLLKGHLSDNGELIKWEYDCLGEYLDEEQLFEICYEDIETILEFGDIDEDSIGEPQLGVDYISFYIEI